MCNRERECAVMGVLRPEEALGPIPIQGDEHKHQPLGVKWDPAKEERENNHN